ncbi:hypothetical protein EZV62_004953 [Acer yangbiense]|uniref:CCHC-type domain-containing protein n=1 Tax=Acer yangbiense TaxID=1000413 RepID=A0A5C7ILH5_9ROSI|nr:hypothetical protein EZV62_004953 [Acer yangbiense]
MAYLNREIGLHLGGLVGQVKEINVGESGECVGKLIRIRVIIDITIPLKRGLRVALGEDEKVIEVMICYEHLLNFCYFCGKIGHLVRDCPLNTKNITDNSGFKFGPWMRAASLIRNKDTWGHKNSPTGSRQSGSTDTLGENQRKESSGGSRPEINNQDSMTMVEGENVLIQEEATRVEDSRGKSMNQKKWKMLAREKRESVKEDKLNLGKRDFDMEIDECSERKKIRMGNPRTFVALRALVLQENPKIIFLAETRLPQNNLDRIRYRLGFDNGVAVDRVGQGGGLILL